MINYTNPVSFGQIAVIGNLNKNSSISNAQLKTTTDEFDEFISNRKGNPRKGLLKDFYTTYGNGAIYFISGRDLKEFNQEVTGKKSPGIRKLSEYIKKRKHKVKVNYIDIDPRDFESQLKVSISSRRKKHKEVTLKKRKLQEQPPVRTSLALQG